MAYIKGTPEGDAYLQGVAEGIAQGVQTAIEQLEGMAEKAEADAAKAKKPTVKRPAIRASLVRGI